MNTRREFVAAAGGVMLAGMGATAPAFAADTVLRRPGGTPARSVFVALRGQPMLLRSSTRGDFAVTLLRVRGRPTTQIVEQFSLVLRGPAQQPLQAGMYRLAHDAFGSTMLRVDPSGRDAYGLLYRSDFSLLL